MRHRISLLHSLAGLVGLVWAIGMEEREREKKPNTFRASDTRKTGKRNWTQVLDRCASSTSTICIWPRLNANCNSVQPVRLWGKPQRTAHFVQCNRTRFVFFAFAFAICYFHKHCCTSIVHILPIHCARQPSRKYPWRWIATGKSPMIQTMLKCIEQQSVLDLGLLYAKENLTCLSTHWRWRWRATKRCTVTGFKSKMWNRDWRMDDNSVHNYQLNWLEPSACSQPRCLVAAPCGYTTQSLLTPTFSSLQQYLRRRFTERNRNW